MVCRFKMFNCTLIFCVCVSVRECVFGAGWLVICNIFHKIICSEFSCEIALGNIYCASFYSLLTCLLCSECWFSI